MKAKLLRHADNEREEERTDERECQCAVVDLAFAFISRTQEKHEEKSSGESHHKGEDKQRSVVRIRGVRRCPEQDGRQKCGVIEEPQHAARRAGIKEGHSRLRPSNVRYNAHYVNYKRISVRYDALDWL